MSYDTRSQQWQSSPKPQNWGKIPWVVVGVVVAVGLYFLVSSLVQSYNMARNTNPTISETVGNKNKLPNETPFANVIITFSNTAGGCNATRSQTGSISFSQKFFPKPCGQVSNDEFFQWLEDTIDDTNRWVVKSLRENLDYIRRVRNILRFLPPAP